MKTLVIIGLSVAALALLSRYVRFSRKNQPTTAEQYKAAFTPTSEEERRRTALIPPTKELRITVIQHAKRRNA